MDKNDSLNGRKNVLNELKLSFMNIKDTHNYLKRLSKEGEEIISAGNWLLDNIYLIEKEYKAIKVNMPKSYFQNLYVENEINSDIKLPRIYICAKEMIKRSKGKVTEDDSIAFIKEKGEKYTIGELWAFPLALRAGIIINLSKEATKLKNIQKDRKEEREYKNILNSKVKEDDLVEKISSLIMSLREIDVIDWRNFFEETSITESILKKDPSNVYENMDFKSKDYYRHTIERISRKYNVDEEEIVKEALSLANRAKEKGMEFYRLHIGYYLIDDGVEELSKAIKRGKRIKNKFSTSMFWLINIIGSLSIVFLVLALGYLYGVDYSRIQYTIEAIIIFIPASEIIVALTNWIVTKKVPLRHMPKIDLRDGINSENKTIVIVPSMITSEENIKKLVEKLEVSYLGNKEENVYFVILGDFQDCEHETTKNDKNLNDFALKQIEKLNKKYCISNNKFFYLNRKRVYNSKEEKFIGRERKRGKIMEFISLLKGDKNHTFNVISSPIDELKDSKYIITLDSDTFMPRDTIKKLVGAMCHPLNKAILKKNRVIRGYGVMQPKISISLESKNMSKFSSIFGGEGGVDGYSTAYSDTYQDLFGEGSFTGKGILDINVFYKVLRDEIPDNKVLSHDLLEGAYVRSALVTDCEFIDNYPSSYLSSSKRLHRWVRGDWQLIPWLFSSKISLLSKWKIIDNLRRSLLAPSLLIGLIIAFRYLNRGIEVSIILFLAIITPLLFTVTDFVVTPKNKLSGTFKSFKQIVLIISFIPYQTYLMVNAIIKTLYRLIISKKHLLEWQTAEDAEKSIENHLGYYYEKMWFSLIAGAVIVVVGFNSSIFFGIMSIILSLLWVFSPLIAYEISKIDKKLRYSIKEKDYIYLREISRRIWAYYEDFINEENNYLAPDNYQEKPFKGVAHRTSPTNIGMGLITNIVSYDLGYISINTVIDRLEKILGGMNKLSKYKGHYLNWYDTTTCEPLYPRYVSTVDSGNLLGYLYVLKETLEEYKNNPLIRREEIQSLKDTYKILNIKDNVNISKYKTIDDYKIILKNELEKVKMLEDEKDDEEYNYWINKLTNEIEQKLIWADNLNKNNEDSIAKVKELVPLKERIDNVIKDIELIMKDMDFTVLYDKKRELFSIGYNLEEDSLGSSYYDLLASESRIASFLAIARNEVSTKHWFRLGRAMSNSYRGKSLVSWSGTMFEYLMPNLIMKDYDNTLLSLTYKSVIKAQIAFARKKRIPWGISEYAYYHFDVAENYQYKAFGVPGIELKRGLEDEIVVSPYSTIMALPIANGKAIENLKVLEKEGALRRYGFIEAIDFTQGRDNKILNEDILYDNEEENEDKSLDEYKYNEDYKKKKIHYDVVRTDKNKYKIRSNGKPVVCYMVHHLGMSYLALDNMLNSNILKERFHRIPEIKATELLLKEKIPNYITFEREDEILPKRKELELEEFTKRSFEGAIRENNELLLLSNGGFSSMITTTGSGYSKKDNNLLYRWKGDSTSDNSGMFFYIKNITSNKYWSATYEPCKREGEYYKVDFSIDKGCFYTKHDNIESKLEVVLSLEDDVDIRKLTLKNNGDKEEVLEITSYMETTLTSFEGDAAHPSFSNLFIQTEFDEESETLLSKRRPRVKNGKIPFLYHKAIVNGNKEDDISYETSRVDFIGRDRDLNSPKALEEDTLKNNIGIVLDPIMSIRTKVRIQGNEEKTIYFITGISESKEDAIRLSGEYSDIKKLEKAFAIYNKGMQVELRNLGITENQANIYQELASYILFLNDRRKDREDYIKNINKHQKDLWAYGISGDLKIILLEIKNDDDLDTVRFVLKMHNYFRIQGLKTDLIIYNDEEDSYDKPLQNSINQIISSTTSRDMINKQGGIFVHNKATMLSEIKDFLIGISAIYIDSEKGIELRDLKSVDRKNVDKELLEDGDKILLKKNLEDSKTHLESLEELDLDFFNGYGGFDKKDYSYVIKLSNYKSTPAPWINVISNDNFGFFISETGASHTWYKNSRENKITPWSNDWVKDPLGEAIYVRDNNSGTYFSITPKPVRDGGEYIIRHGFGYSSFSHNTKDINSSMIVFAPRDENLKIQKVVLENKSNEDKEISVFYYAQLVLGVLNYDTSKYITTYNKENYIYGQNPYSEFFGNLKAYSTILGGESLSFTCDRKEFIGASRSMESPKGLEYRNLKGQFGSDLDPCLVTECKINIKKGEKREVVILLGEEEKEDNIKNIIEKYSNISNVYEELNRTKIYWRDFLGNISVKTENKSMDYLLNGWLLYQNYSCRYLARTAFYQSGGAYGFRDQLQDSMSLGLIDSNITKTQILRSASRQYLEGDVQHWWHPVINSGIRTRFSDDLLWLPFVTEEYIKVTGDYSILKEKAPYLEDEPLREGEDERYTIVNQSSKEGTIYEHCIKAIEKSLKFGVHNIPLMGSGDWNDGMSTVGNKGKGESVWLGWFLYKILSDFEDLANYMNDEEKINKYKDIKEFIRENIEKNAWDGKWYKRAYFDDGTPLGSKENEECKIDSLSQSFALISGGGDKERGKKAIESTIENLVDEELGLIKLLAPPFEKSKLEPGYIKGYVAGVRENGGQYTHAATWVILALTKLNMGDKALKYFNMINPINHTRTETECEKYKLEPYVMAADVYIREPHGGRGGWSWYTGTAGWMYKVGLENILGFTKYKGEGYKINPCVPREWSSFEININNEKEQYKITVKKGTENKIIINGKEIKGDIIPKDLGKAEIEVYYKD
ncbi:glycosyl transferase [Clostridium baratii]|uniref:GH36-type glycosyl hydrolase domain-containing protein n=1 Tax=Clostridium baratii TaxID=1561 RepID=UPI0009A42976|nr:glucoamylase family protein [Clostridium baratii]OPF58703.1 glycosyl transferase [Clostridium baratii]